MTRIDAAILSLTEWCCRRFQLLSGRSNIWLALQLTNLSIVIYFVWAGAVFWSHDWPTRILLAAFCSALLYILTQTIFREPIEASEASALQRLSKGYRNPRRVRDLPLRISFLTLSIVFFYPIILIYRYQHLPGVSLHLRIRLVLLSYSLIVLTTVVLYVLACDPLPPCVGKVRAWLRNRGSEAQKLRSAEEIPRVFCAPALLRSCAIGRLRPSCISLLSGVRHAVTNRNPGTNPGGRGPWPSYAVWAEPRATPGVR